MTSSEQITWWSHISGNRRAIKNLAATTWFGITERMNESLCLFFYSHHLRPREAADYAYDVLFVTSMLSVLAFLEDVHAHSAVTSMLPLPGCAARVTRPIYSDRC